LLEGNKYKSYLVKWLCINRMLEKMFGKRYNTRQILGEDIIYYGIEPYLNNWPRINCRMEGMFVERYREHYLALYDGLEDVYKPYSKCSCVN